MSLLTALAIFVALWCISAVVLAFLLGHFFRHISLKLTELQEAQQAARSEAQGRTQHNIFQGGHHGHRD